VPPPTRRSPEAYLAARVDELDGHWLELQCACGLVVKCPMKLLARDHRVGAKRVDQVYGRFRCKHCGGRPVRVGIVNGPACGTMYPETWTVMLVDRQAG